MADLKQRARELASQVAMQATFSDAEHIGPEIERFAMQAILSGMREALGYPSKKMTDAIELHAGTSKAIWNAMAADRLMEIK